MTLSVTMFCHCAESDYAECRYAEFRYAECHYAECRYAECRYSECRYAECRGALLNSVFDREMALTGKKKKKKQINLSKQTSFNQ
jgi:hypothetical protein